MEEAEELAAALLRHRLVRIEAVVALEDEDERRHRRLLDALRTQHLHGGPEALEAEGDLAALALAGVGEGDEGGRAQLDPVVVSGGGERRRRAASPRGGGAQHPPGGGRGA